MFKVFTPVYVRLSLLSLPIYPFPVYFSMYRASCSQGRADSSTGVWARAVDGKERPLQKHLYRWVVWQLADCWGVTGNLLVSPIQWAVPLSMGSFFLWLSGGLGWSWSPFNYVFAVFPIPSHSLLLLGLKCAILSKRQTLYLAIQMHQDPGEVAWSPCAFDIQVRLSGCCLL